MRIRNIDLTKGPITKNMIIYTVPTILSGILQLLYMSVDLVVIGQFAGEEAFAAVGSTGHLNNLFTTMFIAVSGGGCICVAQYYGAKDGKNVHETVHTSIAVSIICGIALAVIMPFFARDALIAMGTHTDILDLAETYLIIILFTFPFTLFFNFAAGVLRATGDANRPFLILVFTGFVNVVLNLVFVIFFKMSVAGVALATLIGAILNCVLSGYFLVKSHDSIRLDFKKLKIYPDKLKKVLYYAIPSGLLSMLFSFSNVIQQSAINSFNSVDVVAGNSAASNIEGIIYTSMNSIAGTALNYSGQNFGARKYKRVTQSLISAYIINITISLSLAAIIIIFGDALLSIYQPDSAAARGYGMQRIYSIIPIFFLCGLMEITNSIVRGAGSAWVPSAISFMTVGVLRICWVLFVFPLLPKTLSNLYIAWPLTWSASVILTLGYYILWRKKLFAKNEALYADDNKEVLQN